ncbi:hypothetical protein JTE90_002143 [Oedothorax gibbosus]|uniref:Uncharacterized protein n=1 Tax=Oedothorax gibbosus TaxID=931172 RepID=A0AAV6V8A5_9ARAC|nr:hypothetical protein JTE90_002143 [Oedothorax gibbosus]
MDVSVKNSERKLFVVEPFDNSENAERRISVSNIRDGIIVSGNKSEQYGLDAYKNRHILSESKDEENNTCQIICENHHQEISKTTNFSETCVNDNKQMPMVCCSTVSNSLHESTETSGIDNVNSGTKDENTVRILDVTEKMTNNGCEITTGGLSQVSILNSETNDALTICTIETDKLLKTCNEKAETTSDEFPKNICSNGIMKGENIIVSIGGNQLLQVISEIEMFFDAVNSTNNDMQKKSGILLQKQNLVDEIVSYIHAVQSVNRLSTSRNLFTENIPKESMPVYQNKTSKQTSKAPKPYYEASKPFYKAAKQFYEAGEHILEELGIYRRELQEDFKVWEAYRKEILEISDQMLDDFEYCEDEMSAKVLMHEISTSICNILRRMEMITSKRENKNENCIELMDSVDTYIRYSSAFVTGNMTLHHT